MTVHYEIKNGEITAYDYHAKKGEYSGLEWVSSKRISDMSDGEYTQAGWLYTDNVHMPLSYGATDTIGPVQSQLDGKWYDSKAMLRQSYKDHGVVEVGNDSQATKKPRTEQIDWKAAVAESIQQLKHSSPTKKGKKK